MYIPSGERQSRCKFLTASEYSDGAFSYMQEGATTVGVSSHLYYECSWVAVGA